MLAEEVGMLEEDLEGVNVDEVLVDVIKVDDVGLEELLVGEVRYLTRMWKWKGRCERRAGWRSSNVAADEVHEKAVGVEVLVVLQPLVVVEAQAKEDVQLDVVAVDEVDVDAALQDDDGVEPLIALLQLVVDEVLEREDVLLDVVEEAEIKVAVVLVALE